MVIRVYNMEDYERTANMKVLMLISDGFEEVEALTTVDLLRRAGIEADMCSMTGESVLHGARRIDVYANCVFEDIMPVDTALEKYVGVVLPGGLPNAHNLRDDARVIGVLKAFAAAGKITAAICAAPCALEAAGLLDGIEATSYPGCIDERRCIYKEKSTVVSGNIVTSRGVGTAIDFALTLIGLLAGCEAANKVAESILAKRR